MKQLTLDEALLLLIDNEQILKISKEEAGLNAGELKAMLLEGEDGSFPDELYDGIVEAMDEGEVVDSAEIEFLSSYSTTSEFCLCEFGGIYYITNLEQGCLGYFTSVGDAKKAAKKEYGFDWDDPASFNTSTDVDELPKFID
jgi:hypothetical protein